MRYCRSSTCNSSIRLFDDYYWQYDNDGMKLAQLRFYMGDYCVTWGPTNATSSVVPRRLRLVSTVPRGLRPDNCQAVRAGPVASPLTISLPIEDNREGAELPPLFHLHPRSCPAPWMPFNRQTAAFSPAPARSPPSPARRQQRASHVRLRARPCLVPDREPLVGQAEQGFERVHNPAAGSMDLPARDRRPRASFGPIICSTGSANWLCRISPSASASSRTVPLARRLVRVRVVDDFPRGQVAGRISAKCLASAAVIEKFPAAITPIRRAMPPARSPRSHPP